MDRLEIDDLRNKYIEIYNVLSEILLVNQFRRNRIINNKYLYEVKASMDIVEMNEWLISIVEFYKKNGIEVIENDFIDMFPKNSLSNRRINDTINRYMHVFFENINDPSSKKFNDIILHGMNDLGILAGINPIIDEIVMGINELNFRHKNIFNDIIREKVNKYMEELSIYEVNLDNLDDVLSVIKSKIEDIDNSLSINNSNDIEVNDKDNNIDEKLDRLCMLITKGKYNEMNQDEKFAIVNKMPLIIDMIVKLRIFDYVKDKYIDYAKDAGYENILKEVLEKDKLVKGFKEEFEIETKNLSMVENKKGLFKGRELRNIKLAIVSLGNSIVKYNSEIEHVISNYLEGFYNKYSDISKLEKEYNISGIQDKNKLFGVFDFRMLPPTIDKINEMKEFKNISVCLPSMDSIEFREVSKLSLEFINYLNLSISDINKMEDVSHKR